MSDPEEVEVGGAVRRGDGGGGGDYPVGECAPDRARALASSLVRTPTPHTYALNPRAAGQLRRGCRVRVTPIDGSPSAFYFVWVGGCSRIPADYFGSEIAVWSRGSWSWSCLVGIRGGKGEREEGSEGGRKGGREEGRKEGRKGGRKEGIGMRERDVFRQWV